MSNTIKDTKQILQPFKMIWGNSPSINKIQSTEYNVQHYLEYESSPSPKTVVGVSIILCRKLSYHIINIYIPSLSLVLIAGFCKLPMALRDVIIFFKVVSNPLNKFQSLTPLSKPLISLESFLHSRSMASMSSFFHNVFFHSSIEL